MLFDPPLVLGSLLRRYKRFLADVILDDGRQLTCHLPNSGAMTGCAEPGMRVAISHQPKPTRKFKWTWELVQVEGTWVCVNTTLANPIVAAAIEAERIRSLSGYPTLRREVNYGQHSRVDILLENQNQRCYVEVKNCTLRQGNRALFPDAVTARGAKHLLELAHMVQAGHRAVIFFLVNRSDCSSMAPAEAIDPNYACLLREVNQMGVEAMAYRTHADLTGVRIQREIPVHAGD
jgi:sugar fermentation stimulation protein A